MFWWFPTLGLFICTFFKSNLIFQNSWELLLYVYLLLQSNKKAFFKSQMRAFAKNSTLLILSQSLESFVFAQDMACQKRGTGELLLDGAFYSKSKVDGFLHLGFYVSFNVKKPKLTHAWSHIKLQVLEQGLQTLSSYSNGKVSLNEFPMVSFL